MEFYDEMALLVTAAGALDRRRRSTIRPFLPLEQFGTDAFLYQASSPWDMMGKFCHQERRPHREFR